MSFWFLENLHRLQAEKSAIEQLGGSAAWLMGFTWGVDGEGLYLDATVRAHSYDYDVRMRYPTHFPFVPPAVQPGTAREHWSAHQYTNGTLCLEWGPDTWHPDITGAQVLQSAYTLLEIENPLGSHREEGTDRESWRAASRHSLTLGQEMRSGAAVRFYAGSAIRSYLLDIPSTVLGTMTFSLHRQSKSFLVNVKSVTLADAPVWKDSEVPPGVTELDSSSPVKNGLFYKTGLPAEDIAKIATVDELLTTLQITRGELQVAAGRDSLLGLLLVEANDALHFLILWDVQRNDLYHLALLPVATSAPASRLPVNLKGLSERKVAIVGVGSAGSKIAVSLARMGVTDFLLVDDDIFLPENICRHDLDWLNIGEHKVDALAQRLSRINAGIRVDTSKLNLTGQESPSALNALTTKLGTFDLIIDATASAEVFGLLAAVTSLHKKPLLWLEVYAGGIGGMIARSRPGLDPDAHTMRRIYAQYTSDHPFSDAAAAPEGTSNYELVEAAGTILAASDADVGVISGHSARLAVDTLLEWNPSHFPYSIYLIGLEQAWVFEAPFSTIPIATDQFLDVATRQEFDAALLMEATDFLTYLIEQVRKAKEADGQA